MVFLQKRRKKRRHNLIFSIERGLLWGKESSKSDFTGLRAGFLCSFGVYRTAIISNSYPTKIPRPMEAEGFIANGNLLRLFSCSLCCILSLRCLCCRSLFNFLR